MSFAPPVSKDGFSYGDEFFVTVDGHRVARESAGRLYDLVNYTTPAPVLTKAGKVAKRQPPPHKDLPAHFYQGQLMHYGLKVFKTRDAAKKQLQGILEASPDGKSLTVPPHILNLEKELEKLWGEVNSAAKKKYYEDRERSRLELIEKRRKAQEARTVTVKAFYEDTVLKPSLDDKTMALSSEEDSDEHSDEWGSDSDGNRDQQHRVKKKATMSKIELNTEIASLPVDEARELLKTLLGRVPDVQVVLEKEFSHRKALKTVAKPPKGSKLNWAGDYSVLSPDLCSQWSQVEDTALTLKLLPSSTASHIWASFEFGIFSGVIRSTNLTQPVVVGSIVDFHWRGRESGEGQMTFDKSNKGKIRFLGNGKVDATMCGGSASTFKFFGTSNPKNGKSSEKQTVKDMKSEWRYLNDSTHGAEGIQRWGSWAEEGKSEKPAYPDTDGVESDRSEEDEGSGIDWAF